MTKRESNILDAVKTNARLEQLYVFLLKEHEAAFEKGRGVPVLDAELSKRYALPTYDKLNTIIRCLIDLMSEGKIEPLHEGVEEQLRNQLDLREVNFKVMKLRAVNSDKKSREILKENRLLESKLKRQEIELDLLKRLNKEKND